MIRTLFLPTIKKYARLIISMIIISSLGIGMATGFSGSYKTLDKTLHGFISDYSYADITINIEPTDKEDLSFLYSDDRIEQIDLRLIIEVPMRTEDDRHYSIRALSICQDSFLNHYTWEEDKKIGYVNVGVDHKFAINNDLHVGDIVEAKLEGEDRRFCIGEIVSYAENLTMIRDKYSWGENKDFGFFYFDEDKLRRTDYYKTRNEISICLKESYLNRKEEILNEISKELEQKSIVVKDSYVYEDSSVYKSIDANLRTMKNLSLLTPGLFFVCMLIVIWLFMSQIIAQCRRNIGILKAIGFHNRDITVLYSFISLTVSIVGSVLGLAIGAIVEKYTISVYQNFFSLPEMQHASNTTVIIFAIIATIVIGQTATLLSTRSIITILPSEAMTRVAAKPVRKSSFELKLTKPRHIDIKYSSISILRNKKRFIFSTLCIAASITIIFVGLAFNISKNYVLDQMCGDHVKYDIQMFFENVLDDEKVDDLENNGAYNIEQLNYKDADIYAGDKSKRTIICGIEPDSELAQVFDEDMNYLEIPQKGIILEKHLADELGVKVGDYIEAFDKKLEIKDISYHSVSRIQYVSVEQLNKLTTPDNYSVICNTENAIELSDYVTELSDFHYSNIMSHIKESNIHSFKTYSVGVMLLIIFAVLLGFQIVFNTMQMDLYEQQRELSVLRSLGFRISRISKILTYKQAAEFIIASFIGLPFGVWFAKVALDGMSTDVREYPFVSTPYLYIITCLIVIGYMIVSHMLVTHKIRKWDLVENIKEKE